MIDDIQIIHLVVYKKYAFAPKNIYMYVYTHT